jgi:hypothetical protein
MFAGRTGNTKNRRIIDAATKIRKRDLPYSNQACYS